jgi:hypothetical protein
VLFPLRWCLSDPQKIAILRHHDRHVPTVLSEEAIVPVPSHLSFEEAATLPCAAVTAWVALTGHRQVTAGDPS